LKSIVEAEARVARVKTAKAVNFMVDRRLGRRGISGDNGM
jgi:hypothetical protein